MPSTRMRVAAWLVFVLACGPPRAGATRAGAAHAAFTRPFYDAPLWKQDVGAKTAMCNRQMLVNQGNMSLRNALDGMSLSLAFEDNAPDTILDDSGAVTGPTRPPTVRLLSKAEPAGTDYFPNYAGSNFCESLIACVRVSVCVRVCTYVPCVIALR